MPLTLADIQVLVLDCQATGVSPSRGHLLEAGWFTYRASESQPPGSSAIRSHVIELPPGSEIPPAVQRITGLSPDNLSDAVTSTQLWHALCRTAEKVAASIPLPDCPTVIHFARFEQPFLQRLHQQNDAERAFPFRIICTHDICRRLFPDLPRRGLRAMAGFWGHSVSQGRRAAAHVLATAVIWRELLQPLQAVHGIRTLDQLEDWLAETRPNSRARRRFPMDRAVRLSLPDLPGVYRMRRSNGDLLYVGKAASLKKRVNSYFRSAGPQAEHILEMLTQARQLEVTVTGSALEAAVLEGDVIKRHTPPYNLALRRGDRRTAFCSGDLRHIRHRADRRHCIGPLPSEGMAQALVAFGEWFQMDPEDALNVDLRRASRLLGIPEAYGPDIDCLRGGLAQFLEQHRQPMRQHAVLRVITTIGTRFWRDALAAVEIEADPEKLATDPPAEESNSLTWTPESVARALAQSLSRLAHLIRRSRWLCMLSESCVAWERPAGQALHWVGVVFEKGALGGRTNGHSRDCLSIPPGFGKGRLARQRNFDVNTYDRVRIVTTELRRLISENRDVRICLGPRVVLRRTQIARVLQWV